MKNSEQEIHLESGGVAAVHRRDALAFFIFGDHVSEEGLSVGREEQGGEKLGVAFFREPHYVHAAGLEYLDVIQL